MNVVILSDFAYVDGGASKIALGSAKALAQRGHRVILFTAVGPVDDNLLNVRGLEVHCLNQDEIMADPDRLRAIVRGFWNLNAGFQFREILRTLSPYDTVVHLHTWTKALSSSVVRAALDCAFGIVLTLHDYFSVCPAGSFFIHPAQKICTLKPMSSSCISTNCDSRGYSHKLWRVGRQWIQNHLGQLPSGIREYISISDLSETIVSGLLPPSVRIHRVPNFIDIEQGDPADVARSQVFSFAGRLSPEKGPRLLAACAQTLDFDVLFIGDGPLREELARLVPRALFTGWVSPKAAREAMFSSRALVFPSLWYETQGLVVAEAAAMGLPVIVPSTCAARDWVKDGVTGLVFRGGDAVDLAKKIAFLRDDVEAAIAMGMAAYQSYWKNPTTLEQHCENLEIVYKEILSANLA